MAVERVIALISAFAVAAVAGSVIEYQIGSVFANVESPWNAPPLVLEVLEFVKGENPSAFFPYISWLIDRGLLEEKATPKDLYRHVTDPKLASKSPLDPASLPFLKLALALHVHAPGVQASYQFYDEWAVKAVNVSSTTFSSECPVWIEWYGQQFCDVNARLPEPPKNAEEPEILSIDYFWSSPALSHSGPARTIILYADIIHRTFPTAWKAILEKVKTENLNLVVRYRPGVNKRRARLLGLAGYGAELMIKSQEYKVIDDRSEKGETAQQPGQKSSEEEPVQVQGEADEWVFEHTEKLPSIQPIKKGYIADIGLKTTAHILRSPFPLNTLVKLSADFPRYAHHIDAAYRTPIQLDFDEKPENPEENSEEFTASIDDLKHFRNVVGNARIGFGFGGAPQASLYINGIEVDVDRLDVFSVFRTLHSESGLVRALSSAIPQLTTSDIVSLFSAPVSSAPRAGAGPTSDPNTWGDCFDVRTPARDKDVLVWWNDLEKDSRYKQFPSELFDILRPTYPNQLRYMRKNLFSVLFVLDLSSVEQVATLVEILQLIERDVPIRFGITPIVSELDSPATLAALAFFDRLAEKGRKGAKEFILQLRSHLQRATSPKAAVLAAYKLETSKNLEKDVIAVDASSIDGIYSSLKAFADRLGLRVSPDGAFSPVMSMNGKLVPLDESYQQNMLSIYFPMIEHLQAQVYRRKVTEKSDIFDHFMSLPHVHSRRNRFVFTSKQGSEEGERNPEALRLRKLAAGEHDQLVNSVLDRLVYHGNCYETPIIEVQWDETADDEAAILLPNGCRSTIIIAADFGQPEGLKLAQEALKFLELPSSYGTRVAFLSNGEKNAHAACSSCPLVTSSESPSSLLSAITKELETCEKAGQTGPDQRSDGCGTAVESIETILEQYMEKEAFIANVMGLKSGEAGILLNGRAISPLPNPPADAFSAEDFNLLVSYEWKVRNSGVTQRLFEILKSKTQGATSQMDGQSLSKVIMKMTSAVVAAAAELEERAAWYSRGKERMDLSLTLAREDLKECTFTIGDKDSAMIHAVSIFDPASNSAQKIGGVLEALSKLPSVYLHVILIPALDNKEMPVNRFYRFLFPVELQFNEENGEIAPPSVGFHNIPQDALLTLGLDVPGAWVVTPTNSKHDLDNLRLSAVAKSGSSVHATFLLKNILVEGHGQDSRGAPPRGAQFILGTPSNPAMVDTITMANLGYLQLKANPGVWTLMLRPGASTDVFELEEVRDTLSSRSARLTGRKSKVVVLSSFEGVTVFPRVRKRPGMEAKDVLKVEEELAGSRDGQAAQEGISGIWGSIKNKFSNMMGQGKASAASEVPTSPNADINIFSVASGHLYERFLGIMMLSVMKNTNSTVKFWLIENFLSPSFKEFIPYLAKEHGFDYELVTYKWPHWLRQQTEKQRTIWGYKILFLDVLFPLSLDKVIFVDADQVVRTDMQELVEMDLSGAVYGYTPFCDSRKEMDGFRFWNSGYWKQHLQGRAYHISALYVVDLKRFRQLAAGDRLRGQYQMLSADPNSLANLDQDLPNNMIHNIPMFSLPQEWLWCETWCSDAELKTAKTIDLCNNPQTKEPKLERAKRILPEWEGLDEQVQSLARKISTGEVASNQSNEGPLGGSGKLEGEL
ncbi:UDP-glucose:glycoprotein glucosyltransferase-domain-containing protein [Cladochytrium replicatum]|nr:UDP-glucose:glycoprotein glucosyltransferase-domain-containing protein [Cladochytrium replicatum]